MALRPALALAVASLPLASALPVRAQSPGTDVFVASIPSGDFAFEGWRNVTDRPGYDNQPAFTPDGTAILYTSQRDGQTDIYRIDLGTGAATRVTATPESEYSPTPMPAAERFSTVRVEADSTQRLWSFALDGSDPRLVLEDVRPVGYHAWIDGHTLGLFVLGSPATLQIADTRDGTARVAARDIGRSLARVPGGVTLAYLQRAEGGAMIRVLDPASGSTRDLVAPVGESADFAWTPSGILLMGAGSTLYAFDPQTDGGWRELADLAGAGIRGITRLAVSPDGARIAVVADDAP